MNFVVPKGSARGRRKTGSWWPFALHAAQILLGPCLAVISSIQPEASLAVHGLVLGGLLLFSGFLGLWVHLNYGLKSAAAQFVLSLLWLVIAWEFLSQVSRTMMVDCAMAQLELQQERLAMDMDEASGQKSAVLDVLKLRMAAMDHTLTEFQHDSSLLSGPEAADKLRRYHLLHTWRLSDASDIQAEVARFKQHAQQVLRQLTRQRREGDGKLHALSQRVRAELSVEDAQMLEAHLEVLFAATEETIRRLEAHETGSEALTAKEYPQLLSNLERAMAATSGLIRKVEERLGSQSTPLTHKDALALLSGLDPGGADPGNRLALQSTRANAKRTADALRRQEAGYSDDRIHDAGETARAWRHKWEKALALPSLHQRTAAYLDRLPSACQGQVGAGRLAVRVAGGALAVNLASMWGTLGALRKATAMLQGGHLGLA
ncbi:hypothetical protein ACKKBG_A02865 [Auxenochlorella protothecoides x Auxenochlorella symbiontica]